MIGDAGAFHRFGLGPRPGDLRPDMRAALVGELDDPAIALIADDLPGTAELVTGLLARREAARTGMVPAGEAAAIERAAPQLVLATELEARLRHIARTGIGYVERLVMFWTNHFAIEGDAGQTERLLVGAFEREAIRPHLLGSFRDLLGAATRHPAMLSYLDNARSVGPNSPRGRESGQGLNENHARELLELHTIGVDAGYSQDDVIALARIMTGWSYAARADEDEPGTFLFRRAAHEPGAQTVMGIVYPEGGIEQGEAVLDWLAAHPATAARIARKLVRHFLADEPEALVGRLADRFLATDGDLRALALALVESDEAWGDARKLKLPQEFLASAIRAVGPPADQRDIVLAAEALGQPFWQPPSPEGFPDEAENWLAPDALTTRLDVAAIFAANATPDVAPLELAAAILGNEVSADTQTAIARAESVEQAIALFLMSPEFQRR